MMKSFRNPRYLERYEDVVFDTEQALAVNPNDTQYQKRDGIKIVADNTGETTPFDWYNERLSVDFKVDKLADHVALTLTDHNGMVNGSNTLIKKLNVTANGRPVYDCDYGNHCVNIKNLLEYNPSYAKSVGTNEFYFLDTSRSANEDKYAKRNVEHTRNDADNAYRVLPMVDGDNRNYHKGFAARKLLLGLSTIVNCEIPLNRYSFFEELQDKLLPNMKIDLEIEFEDDKNLIWRQGNADAPGESYRLIIKRLQLFIPRLIFNSEGQKLYMENYLKPYKWTYLKEAVFTSNISTQNSGHFRITNGISKPRHVFIFFINNANLNNQLQNPFLYNTFSVSTNPRTLTRCHLEVGNGNEYPRLHYKPTEYPSRVFRDVMKYVNANNDLQGGTLLNITNFKELYPFIYFDLTKQKTDIKDGVTKLAFHYELSGATATDYIIYGIVLHEQEAEIEKEGGKLLLRG